MKRKTTQWNSPFLHRYRNIVGVLWSLLNSKGLSQSQQPIWMLGLFFFLLLFWEDNSVAMGILWERYYWQTENCESTYWELQVMWINTYTFHIQAPGLLQSTKQLCVEQADTLCSNWLGCPDILSSQQGIIKQLSEVTYQGGISMLLSTLAGWATFRCVCICVCLCMFVFPWC